MKASYRLLKKNLGFLKEYNFSALIWIANEEIRNASYQDIKIEMNKMFFELERRIKH